MRPCSKHHPNLELISIQSSTQFGLRSLNGHLERRLQWDQQQWKRSMHPDPLGYGTRNPSHSSRLWKPWWDGLCIRGLWVILLDWPHEGQSKGRSLLQFPTSRYSLCSFPHLPLINWTRMGVNWFCHCEGGGTKKKKNEGRVVRQGAWAGSAQRVALCGRWNR